MLFFGQNELPSVFKENIFSPTINGSLWTLNFEVMLYFIVLALGVSGFLAKKKKFLIFLAIFLSLLLLSKFFEFPYRANLILKLGYPFMSGVVFWIWRRSIPLTISFAAGSAIYITISCFLPLPHFTIWIAATYIIFFLGYSEIPSLKIYNRFGDYSYGYIFMHFQFSKFTFSWEPRTLYRILFSHYPRLAYVLYFLGILSKVPT